MNSPTDRAPADRIERRRRRPTPEVAAPRTPPQPSPTRARRARRRLDSLSAIGLSPAFRAYLFVGSLLVVLGFLLYNESVIRHLREQEKRNVDLYARLIALAPLAADDQSVAIFTGLIINPTASFPIVITDHRGRVIQQRGVEALVEETGWTARWRQWLGLDRAPSHAGDEAERAARLAQREARLAQLVVAMDAQNPPIPFFQFKEAPAYLRRHHGRAVVIDGEGEVIQWRGPGLPAAGDTSNGARAQVLAALADMPPSATPVAFRVPVDDLSYLYCDDYRLVVTDGSGEARQWQGEGLPASADTTVASRAALTNVVRDLAARSEPMVIRVNAENYIHYGDSELAGRVTWAAFAQVGALLLFVFVGYVGLRNLRRAEQRSIWVGMAKETAHQLGTPLSSLAGWLELIREESAVPAGDERLARIGEMAGQMQKDMQRLDQIASRFSQIGSVPELHVGDVLPILQDTAAYFAARAPQFGRHQITVEATGSLPPVPLNADLLRWVFENLFKNAIDAIDHGAGVIDIQVNRAADDRAVVIHFRDNGHGIEPDDLGRVFEPGFSTKQRGWGLGLAFARRIIEEYHGGRIGVLRSGPGQGTTFELVLPVASARLRQPATGEG